MTHVGDIMIMIYVARYHEYISNWGRGCSVHQDIVSMWRMFSTSEDYYDLCGRYHDSQERTS